MTNHKLRLAFVIPHIFVNQSVLPKVIFSPGVLGLELSEELSRQGVDVTIFSPGNVASQLPNITADMTLFEKELAGRNDGYVDLLKKHPFTFVTLARQVQSEIIAKAFMMANADQFDVVHIYTNEEDIALPFIQFCKAPVVLTHHDPFNFLVRYKSIFPKYPDLNWLSISRAQRKSMPKNTNWVANIYHGLDVNLYEWSDAKDQPYLAYLGRIIEPKGVHHAIDAVTAYNKTAAQPLKLKIAGKHYADQGNDKYWQEQILPRLSENIEYIGYIDSQAAKNEFLMSAKALLVPSTFEEPFGMVTIEALMSGTPVIGSKAGATPEIIDHGQTGFVANPENFAEYLGRLDEIDRHNCRRIAEKRFSTERMAREHIAAYQSLLQND